MVLLKISIEMRSRMNTITWIEEKLISQILCVELKDVQIMLRVIVMANYFINIENMVSKLGKDANVNYAIHMLKTTIIL